MKSIWFILSMKITNCIIFVKRDSNEVHNPASTDKKEDNEEATCKYYTEKKREVKNSRWIKDWISVEYKKKFANNIRNM